MSVCSWFYPQMRKDSCPTTCEGPVQPSLDKCGMSKGCSPAPEQFQIYARTTGRCEPWLESGSLWEKWTWRGDCRDELGSSSPLWVLAGSMRSNEVVAYEEDAVSHPYEFQED